MTGGGDRRPMEPFDALMFRSELDPRARSTLLGVFVLDRAPDWDRLVEHYERVTRLIVPLRQRIVEPTVNVGMPTWAVDPDFDLAYHLRRAHVPAPGTERDLLAFLEPMAMAPFDRTRPLWEFTLVEGLEGGRAAWVTKTNHAIADGVGGQQMAQLAFDSERDPADPPEMPPAPSGDGLTPNDIVRGAVVRAPRAALGGLARGAASAVRATDSLLRRPSATVAGATAYARSLGRMMSGPGVEPSPLLRDRGLRRRLLATEVPLDDLKTASKAAGGSLNDGVLAAVCGGLRRYHDELGQPVESVPMAMPVSLRTSDDDSASNRWTGVRLAPPVAEVDPAERIRRIHQLVLEARNEPALDAMNLMAHRRPAPPGGPRGRARRGAARYLRSSRIPGAVDRVDDDGPRRVGPTHRSSCLGHHLDVGPVLLEPRDRASSATLSMA